MKYACNCVCECASASILAADMAKARHIILILSWETRVCGRQGRMWAYVRESLRVCGM